MAEATIEGLAFPSCPPRKPDGVGRRGNGVKNLKGSEAILERLSDEPHKMEESLFLINYIVFR